MVPKDTGAAMNCKEFGMNPICFICHGREQSSYRVYGQCFIDQYGALLYRDRLSVKRCIIDVLKNSPVDYLPYFEAAIKLWYPEHLTVLQKLLLLK